MSNKILFKNDRFLIEDFGNKIIFYKIIGFINVDMIKMIDKELEIAIKKTGAKKVISDTQQMKIITPEAVDYNDTYIIPKWEQLGIKYNAAILSADAFGQWATHAIAQNIENRSKENKKAFELKIFKSEKEAIEWITAQS